MPNVNPCCSVGVGSRCRYFPAQRGPFHRQRLGEDLFTKFFKEGLHEAGPGVEVSCVHIQVGDIFCCEEAREHASSEDGRDLRLLTVRSGQVPPAPLRLLSHTGHSTQLAKHVHNRNDFPNFQTLFSCLHCYRGSPSPRERVPRAPYRKQNTGAALELARGQGLQKAQLASLLPLSFSHSPVMAADGIDLFYHWEVRLESHSVVTSHYITRTPPTVQAMDTAHYSLSSWFPHNFSWADWGVEKRLEQMRFCCGADSEAEKLWEAEGGHE